MPSQDRVRAGRSEHAEEKARATSGRAAPGGASKKPAVPALTDVDCHSHRAGHHVHWMQALNSINKPESARLTWTGRIVALDGLGIDVAQPDGTIVRYLNHHMERLIALSGGVGVNVSVNNHWAILRCGSYGFSINADVGQPLDRCITARRPATLAEAPRCNQLVQRVALLPP